MSKVRQRKIQHYSPLRKLAATPITNPELIFGLVGPIGVDMKIVADKLERHLKDVKYGSTQIHLTDHMKHPRITTAIDDSTYYEKYKSLIDYANRFREFTKDPSALAGLALAKIRDIRKKHGGEDKPALGMAYIIRQFKRPEEITRMRRVYGRKFIQVSVYGSAVERRLVLMDKIRHFDHSPKSDAVLERQAIDLIDTDQNQIDDENGQRISDVFHLGDVFCDGINAERADETLKRFIRALFGANAASPTKDEYGLYTASAAALRSVDLSRQVGAAIFTNTGEIISLGCNEVPKAGGGTYWCDDPEPISRDVERGRDANQERREEIIFDFVKRLDDEKLLAERIARLPKPQAKVDEIMKSRRIRDAQIMDIIEFGRMIHAEMSAITDAARLGRSTKNAILFCTTFPCHLCAKHIVAAGVTRVVFLEPYPKSYAHKLHEDSLTFETADPAKVLFVPFIGISPRRYRDIFEKKKRKDDRGNAMEWFEGEPMPRIEDKSASYIENEAAEILLSLQNLYPSKR